MGPYGYAEDSAAREKAEARLLAAIAEEFPDVDIHGVFGGYEALPRGTEVIRAMTLDSMMGKLAARRAPRQGGRGGRT
jgi:hypothetical protein